jgi:hypothetical protein
MKKLVASLLIVMFVLLAFAPAASAVNAKRGGFMGFIAGCCFGVRSGAAYNDGKDLHFREWCPIIPYVGIIFSIWNGIDCAGGTTTADLAAKYGATYY